MGAFGDFLSQEADRLVDAAAKRDAIDRILAELRCAKDLPGAEAAITAAGEALEMPFAYWVPDISSPYISPKVDAYARSRGWPDELLKLWWKRHGALKMPLYIRCRFEHLPFIVSLDRKRRHEANADTSDEVQITSLIREMGVKTLLVVPLHLSKSRIGMVMWGGSRNADGLQEVIGGVEGDLLAMGYHFMRISTKALEGQVDARDERSRLTPREWDCVRTLAQGYREAEIAELIGIKHVTVRFHLGNVVQKFGCKTRTQAVALLAQLGLLGPIGA